MKEEYLSVQGIREQTEEALREVEKEERIQEKTLEFLNAHPEFEALYNEFVALRLSDLY